MSSILSGAQGGRPCSVSRSTVHNWLKCQRLKQAAHAQHVEDGEAEFGTDPDMSGDEADDFIRSNKRTFRPPKILEEHQSLVLCWRSLHKKSTACKLQMMLILHMRERSDPKQPSFWISELSIRRILQDASYVWKASRRSGAVVFTPQNAIACVN